MKRLLAVMIFFQLTISSYSMASDVVDPSLLNQVILITGASGDIGSNIALEVLENTKARVILHYNSNKQKLQNIVKKYGKNRVKLIQADFLHPEMIKGFFEEAVAWQSKINIVVNSSGIEKITTLLDETLAINQATFNINYISPMMTCEYAIDHFKKNKIPGLIINLGSRAAYRGMPKGLYHYADSKSALLKYTQQIARDNAALGILVYTIAPGPVEGAMIDQLPEDIRKGAIESMATKKVVSLREVTDLALFLMQRKIPSGTGGTIDLMGASWFH